MLGRDTRNVKWSVSRPVQWSTLEQFRSVNPPNFTLIFDCDPGREESAVSFYRFPLSITISDDLPDITYCFTAIITALWSIRWRISWGSTLSDSLRHQDTLHLYAAFSGVNFVTSFTVLNILSFTLQSTPTVDMVQQQNQYKDQGERSVVTFPEFHFDSLTW